MSYFSLDAIAPMPWKNGGGTTRELAVWPPGASMEAFDWRISVADIATDGPFSAFPGIDRQIALLDGAGVVLQARDGAFRHRLARIGAPFAFTGDVAVDATLIDGPTRDFNVMTRRGRCGAVVDAVREPWQCEAPGAATLVLVVDGAWQDDAGRQLMAGDGMLWTSAHRAASATRLTPLDDTSVCLRVVLHGEPT